MFQTRSKTDKTGHDPTINKYSAHGNQTITAPGNSVTIQFPAHDHKAAIESYVTKGTDESKGILYTRARTMIRFGFELMHLHEEALFYEFKLKLRYLS